MSATLHIKCDGIMCDSQHTVVLETWTARIPLDCHGDSSYLFCDKPDCQEQEKFFDAQCPGCVASYPECGLGRAYAYGDSKGLTAEQRKTLVRGICPFRVNGTFSFSRETGFQTESLAEIAPSAAGLAVLAGIDAYVAKYPLKARQ